MSRCVDETGGCGKALDVDRILGQLLEDRVPDTGFLSPSLHPSGAAHQAAQASPADRSRDQQSVLLGCKAVATLPAMLYSRIGSLAGSGFLAREVFMDQLQPCTTDFQLQTRCCMCTIVRYHCRPILLELGCPLKICGDVHGQSSWHVLKLTRLDQCRVANSQIVNVCFAYLLYTMPRLGPGWL